MRRIVTFLEKLAGVEVAPSEPAGGDLSEKVILVGNPNVGKSALFNALTGRYVTVSNYPGTTVEISRGTSKAIAADVEIIDTPGMYSLLPITDEERVAQRILLRQDARAIIHVIDAKNIERMLSLTLQLLEAELPVILALNMTDEARRVGVKIDCNKLEKILGIPVVETVATSGVGMKELAYRIREIQPQRQISDFRVDYGPIIEPALTAISAELGDAPGIGKRTRAILLLQGDHEEQHRLAECHSGGTAFQAVQAQAGKPVPPSIQKVADLVFDTLARLKHTAHYQTALAVKARVDEVLAKAVLLPTRQRQAFRERLSDMMMSPLTGFPILLVVLYFGLYKFVGEFGAGTLVNLIDDNLFKNTLNPWLTGLANAYIPWQSLRDLLVGEFGIFTLGIRYAVAIVLPIVGTFFLAFSIMEDSGYLPRLAMMIDRVFKRIGLNGRAVIPMILGFGCDTMATMVTRTLETKRERVIATFLLALAIPCSAQIGVILGLLAGHPAALAIWAGVIIAVFLSAGLLAAKFLPGERPSFYMELPPLRLPRIGNVIVKTYSRMVWYFKEILPLFVIASVLIWVGQLTGLFQLAIGVMEPVVRSIGLPDEASRAFLFGFFRRDYGVAGLYDMHGANMLSLNQILVAAVTLTLFLPCVAQFLVMAKERGWKMTLWVSAFIAVFAFGMGWLTNATLNALGVVL